MEPGILVSPDAAEGAVFSGTEAGASARRVHIFISYKRDVDPDQRVALEIFRSLSQHHEVFFDQAMPVGTRWANRIEKEIRQADFLITLLSPQSIHSEMVEAEIALAHELVKQQGHPVILPVRLAYRQPFQYPLGVYLNHINWAFWEGPEDTPRLVDELAEAMSGGQLTIDKRSKPELLQKCDYQSPPCPFPSAQPRLEEMPEGTMDPHSDLYVTRLSDSIALEAIKRPRVTLTIKGPRQMGKSSLLIRTIDAAAKAGKRTVLLDFQLIDRAALAHADLFFSQFCAWLTDELGLESKVAEYWTMPLGNSQRCTRYLSRHILPQLDHPLLLAMDEVERIFETSFRSDFFGMLRNWHNSRVSNSVWNRLDLALVTSTEPYQLIDNLNQSPFNVGEVIELADFTPEQAADLNRRHGCALNPNQEAQLMALLRGHPYLFRRALYLLASRRVSFPELLSNATADRGPFGDHLRYHLFRLHDKKELIQGMQQVIRHSKCEDEHVFFRLHGAGLVRREGRTVVPRCQLYADYFREHLHA